MECGYEIVIFVVRITVRRNKGTWKDAELMISICFVDRDVYELQHVPIRTQNALQGVRRSSKYHSKIFAKLSGAIRIDAGHSTKPVRRQGTFVLSL
jgi:hypothetical protein